MAEQVQRQPLDPQLGLGEFLTTMQLFAGISQREVAEHFGVSQQSVSRWMNGTSTPESGSANAYSIKQTFDLTEDELRNLVANNAPWERPDTLTASTSSRAARRRLGAPTAGASRAEVDQPDTTYAARMLGAFVTRAENGPPLNEVEAELIRFLVQSELEHPETPK